jgi:LysR family transcriptional activator of nhaA
MRWLNYQHLFYFWNVANFESVSQAAKHLRLAQPTVSAQLKQFENTLGEKLFERSGRNFKLSEMGLITYRYADQIFSLGKELLDVIDGKSVGHLKDFRIGISDVVPKSLSYRLIEPALRTDSGVNVSCFEDKTERLLADLAIAEIDLVIADRPIPPNVKVKAFNHFIGESGISFMASKKIAQVVKKNFPKSISNAALILPTAESTVRGEIEYWFEQLNIDINCVASFQDRGLMKIAAREGQGIIPVPTVIEQEVKKEFHLEVVGRTKDVKEKIYLISLDKRLKNPIMTKICEEGQRNVFS